jgi:hypothetical protein
MALGPVVRIGFAPASERSVEKQIKTIRRRYWGPTPLSTSFGASPKAPDEKNRTTY